MLSDLLDIASSQIWKLILLAFLVTSASGLYIWASHEQNASERKAREKKQRKQDLQRQKTNAVLAHLHSRGRRFLSIRWTTHKRRLLFWKHHPKQDGIVLPYKKGIKLVLHSKKTATYIADGEGNGMTKKDKYGTVQYKKGELGLPQTHLWDTLSIYRKRKVKKLYIHAFLAVMRAKHDDEIHLRRVKKLRRGHSFYFSYKMKRLKWKFWKKKHYQAKIELDMSKPPHQRSLILIHQTKKKRYGCKRKVFTPWKKKCMGIAEIQSVFIDNKRPGLNVGDGDLLGKREIRNGQVYQKRGLRLFGQLTLTERINSRLQYQNGVRYAHQKQFSTQRSSQRKKSNRTPQPTAPNK